MKKVNWTAKSDHEFIPNYKVLQAAFDKNGIERHIDVDKLIRAKYQDNLEILQWMKCYWEREASGRRDYDPAQAREGKPVPTWARPLGGGAPMTRPGGEKENQKPRAIPVAACGEAADAGKKPAAMVGRSGQRPATTAATAAQGKSSRPAAATGGGYPAEEVQSAESNTLQNKLASQQEELLELKAFLECLERERDYYFRKLRDVEILCTTLQAKMPEDLTAEKMVTDVLGILYSETDEAEAEAAPQQLQEP